MAHKKGLGSSKNGRDSNPQVPRGEDVRRPGRAAGQHHRPPARHEVPPRPRHRDRPRPHDLRDPPRHDLVPHERRAPLRVGRRAQPTGSADDVCAGPVRQAAALAWGRSHLERRLATDLAARCKGRRYRSPRCSATARRSTSRPARAATAGFASAARSSCRRAARTAATAATAATSSCSPTRRCATSRRCSGASGSRRRAAATARGAQARRRRRRRRAARPGRHAGVHRRRGT